MVVPGQLSQFSAPSTLHLPKKEEPLFKWEEPAAAAAAVFRELSGTLAASSDRPKTDFLVSAENEYSARKCYRIFGR
jgi:hypothetical protein